MHLFLVICSCLAVAHSESRGSYQAQPFGPSNEEKEGALFLTDYIKRNKTAEARNKSFVEFFKNFSVEAYSGYITTNEQNTNHLFFLYMNASDASDKTPVILWLYGGPGTSALTAQFVYNGPVGVSKDGFFKRSDTFQKNYHIIYLDAPAGSGFSFSNSTYGFDKTSADVADSIETFLKQFFELFPELKGRKLFVNGESYAARYTVALAAKMEKGDKKLDGIMLGIPFLGNVVDALNPTSFLSCVGMLDQNGVEQFNYRFRLIKHLFSEHNYTAALHVISRTILNSENEHEQTLYANLTGFSWHASALRSDMPKELAFYYNFTNDISFRSGIHVGRIQREAQRLYVVFFLAGGDFNMDMNETFAKVLDSSLPVLMYTAKMDTVAPSPIFHSHFDNIQWSGADQFKKARREAILTNATYPSRQTLRYYKKESGAVTLIDVAGAGHYVSIDKPKVVYEIVNKFIRNINKGIPKRQ